MQTFHKTDPRPGRIAYEVAGLRWLAAAPPPACPVVEVLAHGTNDGVGWLEEPRLPSTYPTRQAAVEFGRALAHTHAAGATHFGAPPPGNTGTGWMGKARLPLPATPEESHTSWGQFYAQMRLLPYADSPAFTTAERQQLETLFEKLATGVYDHAQPRLVRAQGQAARTHGDLWNGNLLWTPDGVVLIDPAAQGGHAEEDLAALAVFGAPHLETIWSAYNEASPLETGWEERIELHQLHMLMVHCQLFGRSYVPATMAIVRHYSG